MTIEYQSSKQYIKSQDVREQYLVRSFPQAGNKEQMELKTLKQSIAKNMRELNNFFLTFSQIKQKLREVLEAQNEVYKDVLKERHLEALYELGLAAIDYIKWSQENAIRSYEAHEAFRMDMWMNEITTKVLTIFEHAIQQMDSDNGGLKSIKKARSYKKLPTQMALRSLRSFSVAENDNIQIQNFNKVIKEEERRDRNFSEHVINKISNDQLPSLANYNRKISFQFQRSPINGKYSPIITPQQISSMTPGNRQDKKSNQKSNVVDAVHTFLNLSESGSNLSTPNTNCSMSDFQAAQAVLRQNAQIQTPSSKNKSLFFSNHNQKPTFNQFEDGQSSIENAIAEENQIETIDQNLKQHENSILPTLQQKNKQKQKKFIVLKNPQQENQLTKNNQNLSILDKYYKYIEKRNESSSSYVLQQNLQYQNNKNNINKEENEEDEQNTETKQRDLISNISNSNIIKYSLEDLLRIDQELKDKRAKLKEETKRKQKEVEEQIIKQKDQSQLNQQNIQNTKSNEIKYDQNKSIQNINIIENINKDIFISKSYKSVSNTQINKSDSSKSEHKIDNQFSQNEQEKLKNSLSQNQNQLRNKIQSLHLDKLNNKNIQYSNADEAKKGYLHFLSSSPQKQQQNKFSNILNQFDNNIFFSPQINQQKPLNKVKNVVENQYFLQIPQNFNQKKQPFLKLDIHKNEIKLQSKIQVQDKQKFNSSLEGNDIKSILDTKNNITQKIIDQLQQQQQQINKNSINRSSSITKNKQKIIESNKSLNLKQLGQRSYLDNSNLNFELNTKNNKSSQINSESLFINSSAKILQDRYEDQDQNNSDVNYSNIQSRSIKLPSLHQNSQIQISTDKPSFNENNSNSQGNIKIESEKRPKVSVLTPQLDQIGSIKQTIDVNQIKYRKKKNNLKQEYLKNILLASFQNK